MSAYFRAAVEGYRRARADFEDGLLAAYAAAEEACRGRMLNRRGERRGIDALSLFYGPAVRVRAYASPELVEWFETNGRTTFAEFERHHFEASRYQ